MTTRLPVTVCPVCEYRADAASDVAGGDDGPTPGDFSICINCASVLTYDERLQLAIAGAQELRDAPDELWAAQAAVRHFAKVKPAYDRLPCGCIAGTETVGGTRTFVFVPHALDCEYLELVKAESEQRGMPLTVVDAR